MTGTSKDEVARNQENGLPESEVVQAKRDEKEVGRLIMELDWLNNCRTHLRRGVN